MTPNIRKVLVTGAAGSIGSEVCRMLLDAGVAVIGLDHAETPLFWLDKELEHSGDFRPVVGSVTDAALVHSLMRHSPQVVVHAAALKHVDLCERNVCEAVKTNLGGTLVVHAAARRHGVRTVLVSTDKAVSPTSVMGATKAAAEALIWGHPGDRIVRLVNIWGSQGSLQHVIQKQIDAGGPVTITDRKMTRMFMGIGDAVRLIGDAVFMGSAEIEPGSITLIPSNAERRRIEDVIAQLIRESGFSVPVVEIGARHGEKLEERLIETQEILYRTERVRWGWRMAARMLVALCNDRHAAPVRARLFELVEARKK